MFDKKASDRPKQTIVLFSAILFITIRLGDKLCLAQKADPITVDLYHRLSTDQDFKPRGSILVRPRTEYRAASASIVRQSELTDSDLNVLSEASRKGDTYYLRAIARQNSKGDKTTQTIIRACSLSSSNLQDSIAVNLSPTNNFISVNLFTSDPECSGLSGTPQPSRKFNTTVSVDYGSTGPLPDTATYIRRLEEERHSKAKEAKEDNRSFILKYWMYIVPAVVFLMVFSGPADQAR